VQRIRLKLMAVLAALVALTVGAAGLVAERTLRAQERADLTRSLQQRAELVRTALGTRAWEEDSPEQLHALATRAARAAEARVTLIAPDGKVLADSDVPPRHLPGVENHGDRPEVRAALAGEAGTASRRSSTVLRRLLYLAAPLETSEGRGAVRLAVDMTEVETRVGALRRQLLAGGAVGLVAALALALFLTRYTVRPLREIRDALGALVRGEPDRRLPIRSRDELGDIARSVNAMAEQLRLRLTQITAEKEQLHAVLASMVEGVLVLDSDARVVLANPRARELLSMWGAVEGRKLLEVARHPAIDEALRTAAGASHPVVSEAEVSPRGGQSRSVLVHAVAFPADGPRTGTVAVFHDVTELRHLENVRRDFVANASHELQTPLTAIRGFAETLLASGLPAETRPQVEVILRNAARLQALIGDMMELSRIESRRLPLHPGEVDVAKLVRTVLQDMEPRTKERGLEVSLCGDPEVPAWADRRAVEQILTNLLDNAAKYTDPGGRITVELEARGEAIRVRVRDTGIGIAAEHRARIFERFYRVDKARSRALGGTGLGLAIVKHLVQALGGEIYVESEPGAGSTFTFTLPRADRRRV